MDFDNRMSKIESFNPYFIGLPILIGIDSNIAKGNEGVSILILLDYLFL